MLQAREQEARRRAQLQFSAPGEPGGGFQSGAKGGIASATAAPQFSSPQVSGGTARPMAGPMPGTVVPRGPGGTQAAGAGAHGGAPFRNVGRNDPCPCGSGKKFKKCHGVDA
jgi:hypothetical protein